MLFLWGAKELFLKKIHPFDFNLSSTEEYQRIVGLGKQLMQEIGLQDFFAFLMEGQYRVHIWCAYIGLEYGNPDKNEILRISTGETIVNHCIELIHDTAQQIDEGLIKLNEENWVVRMKMRYAIS